MFLHKEISYFLSFYYCFLLKQISKDQFVLIVSCKMKLQIDKLFYNHAKVTRI